VADQAAVQLDRYRDTMSKLLAREVIDSLPIAGKEAVDAQIAIAQARLEVAVERWGLAGGSGSDPMMSFFVEASWKVVQAMGPPMPAGRRLIVQGMRRRVSEWTAEDGEALRRAVKDALAATAETIVESAFLVQKFHVAGHWAMDRYCGLEPYAPMDGFRLTPVPLKPPLAPSTTPALRWEPFPTERDTKSDGQSLLTRVSRIRYDLRVWAAELDRPQKVDATSLSDLRYWMGEDYRAGELVYERKGLELPVVMPLEAEGAVGAPARAFVEHTIETRLRPNAVYLWSVRPRFVLDGAERVTTWSFHRDAATRPMNCELDVPPAGLLYRFRTP
jgi:hypothetical protein